MTEEDFEKKVASRIENEKILEKRRSQIVQAASSLFAKKGYHKATMRELSSESGINLSQLYNYISSKDDALFFFYKFIYEELTTAFVDFGESRIESSRDKLVYLMSRQLEIIHEHQNAFRTMYTESRHLEKDSLRAVLSMESKHIARVEKIISQGIQEGVFKPCDPYFAANVINYLFLMEPLRGWSIRKQYSFPEFSEALINLVLDFLGAERKHSGPDAP